MLKTLSLTGLGALGLALAVSACHAGDVPPPPPMMHPPAFADLDANKDGVINKDEFAAPMLQHFGEIDQNGDGTISPAEFDAAHQGMHDHMGPPPGDPGGMRHGPMDLKSLDANGDGKVSFEEFSAPMKQHFDEMDADHDGTLGQSELPAPRDNGDGPPPPPGGN